MEYFRKQAHELQYSGLKLEEASHVHVPADCGPEKTQEVLEATEACVAWRLHEGRNCDVCLNFETDNSELISHHPESRAQIRLATGRRI